MDGLQEETGQKLEIGVWYGLEKELRPITVTTYHSAGDLVAEVGNIFKLLVFDEVHHLPAPSWQEIALMSPAPHRLGLTATYPETNPNDQAPMPRQPAPGWDLATNQWSLEELIGPVVYVKNIDELTGKQLAEYRTERIRVDLAPEERAAYDAEHAVYAAYYREHKLRESYGPGWWGEYTRRSAYDAEARRAKVAERRLKRIVANAQGKLEKLESLLKEHAHQRPAATLSRPSPTRPGLRSARPSWKASEAEATRPSSPRGCLTKGWTCPRPRWPWCWEAPPAPVSTSSAWGVS
jgi:superfamily II DNA or RNA helicase